MGRVAVSFARHRTGSGRSVGKIFRDTFPEKRHVSIAEEFYQTTLTSIAGAADEDGDNRISEQEFVNVLSKPEAVTALTSLGVDVDAALDYGWGPRTSSR